MVMTNKKLYKFLEVAAQSGIQIVRIGTKELAFRPERFDNAFREMLQTFNNRYPNIHIIFVVHFSHPDEFIERDSEGNYICDGHGMRWLSVVHAAVTSLRSFDFVTLENQTPMIDRVNDDPQTLRILHQELRAAGIRTKYIFQCREIEGHRAFAVPLEKAWSIYNESQKGLSDSARSRFVMATEDGKMEIVGMIPGSSQAKIASFLSPATSTGKTASEEGVIIFKMHRAPIGSNLLGALIVAQRNPDALWITGYEDRLVYDGRKAQPDG